MRRFLPTTSKLKAKGFRAWGLRFDSVDGAGDLEIEGLGLRAQVLGV